MYGIRAGGKDAGIRPAATRGVTRREICCLVITRFGTNVSLDDATHVGALLGDLGGSLLIIVIVPV
jgi:hypothetical protein